MRTSGEVLEFDGVLFPIVTSRICRLDRPRWWVLGTEGAYVKFGIDPQEDALRGGDIDRASEPPEHRGRLRVGTDPGAPGGMVETVVPTVHGHWDAYYANIADALLAGATLGQAITQAVEAAGPDLDRLPDNLRTWFHDWAAEGFFRGIA